MREAKKRPGVGPGLFYTNRYTDALVKIIGPETKP